LHTVKVRFLRNYKDGDSEEKWKASENSNTEASEATFRIRDDTTFHDLKTEACRLWKIENEDKVSLRARNLASLKVFDDSRRKQDETEEENPTGVLDRVSKAVLDHSLYPEFYLFETNIRAKQIFVEMENFFVVEN
jgi:hypothetical protein